MASQKQIEVKYKAAQQSAVRADPLTALLAGSLQFGCASCIYGLKVWRRRSSMCYIALRFMFSEKGARRQS